MNFGGTVNGLRHPPHLPFSKLIYYMDFEHFQAMAQVIIGNSRDLVVFYAPLIGLLGALKFLADWVHKIIFSKKV